MQPRPLSPAAALALVFATASPARAADAPIDSGRRSAAPFAQSQGSAARLELDLLSASATADMDGIRADVSSLGVLITLIGQIRLTKKLHLDLELPLAYGSVSTTFDAEPLDGFHTSDSASAFLFGNPTLGAHYAVNASRDLAVFAGGTLSIPTLHDLDKEEELAVGVALKTRAFFDTHRLAPELLALRPRGGLELRITPRFFYRGDAALLLGIPTGSGNADFFIEQGNELDLRSSFGLFGGLRVQEVFTLTKPDKVQTALEPFAGYALDKARFYGRVGLLVALDETLGFGFDQDKVATLRFAVGASF